jgi:hypothetical protein
MMNWFLDHRIGLASMRFSQDFGQMRLQYFAPDRVSMSGSTLMGGLVYQRAMMGADSVSRVFAHIQMIAA